MANEESAENYNDSSSAAALLAAQALADMDGLSYEDYFHKVAEMVQRLREHWRQEQRVQALKVAIQLAKLLANSNQLRLYARKHKMITETLDEFGRLIHERIHACASGRPAEQSATNSSRGQLEDAQLELAKEICRNWFLKIASIRELVPRFYAELAVLKSCDILLRPTTARGVASIEEQYYAQTLRRLTKTAWGFGDPIVAMHARVYLCRVAVKLLGWRRDHKSGNQVLFEIVLANLRANVALICRLDAVTTLRLAQNQGVDVSALFELISNAIQANVECVTAQYENLYQDEVTGAEQPSTVAEMRARMKLMLDCMVSELDAGDQSPCSALSCNILLHAASRSIDANIVAESAERILNSISGRLVPSWRQFCANERLQDAHSVALTLYQSLASFAVALDSSDSLAPDGAHADYSVGESMQNYVSVALDDSRPLTCRILCSLEAVMDELLQFELEHVDPHMSSHFMRCFTSCFSYANHHVDYLEIDRLLLKFVARIKRKRQFASHYLNIIDLIKLLFTDRKTLDEFTCVIGLKSFSRLFDLLRRDDHKFEVSSWILETMRANLKLSSRRSTAEHCDEIRNKVTVNFLLKLFATINDSLSPLAVDDDLQHLTTVMIYFLDRICVQSPREHLEFLSRCRGSMGNLNHILIYLCRRVLKFASDFRSIDKKRVARQDFLNGCLAFNYVTIPAINDLATSFDLLLEGCQLALQHMSLSLADYYLRQTLHNLRSRLSMMQQATEHEDKLVIVTHSNNQRRAKREAPVHGKRLVDQVLALLRLFVKFEDHIDLKHKLVLTNLIEESFADHVDLIKALEGLVMVGDHLDAGE